MTDNVDRLLKQLSEAPLPNGLARLEADVLRQIRMARTPTAVGQAWRFAAVSVALIVGIGVGAMSGMDVRDASGSLARAVSGGDLAPSSLLVMS